MLCIYTLKEYNSVHGVFAINSCLCFLRPWELNGNPFSTATRCPLARTRSISPEPASLSSIRLCANFFEPSSWRFLMVAPRVSACPTLFDAASLACRSIHQIHKHLSDSWVIMQTVHIMRAEIMSLLVIDIVPVTLSYSMFLFACTLPLHTLRHFPAFSLPAAFCCATVLASSGLSSCGIFASQHEPRTHQCGVR